MGPGVCGKARTVGAAEVVNVSLGQHGVVLELRLAEGRSVGGDDDQLGLAGPQSLERALVAEGNLSGLLRVSEGSMMHRKR